MKICFALIFVDITTEQIIVYELQKLLFKYKPLTNFLFVNGLYTFIFAKFNRWNIIVFFEIAFKKCWYYYHVGCDDY